MLPPLRLLFRAWLPPANVLFPFAVKLDHPTEQILGGSVGLARLVEQAHIRFVGCPPALAAIAGRTGGYQVLPGVTATPMTRYHVVDGQRSSRSSAVLAAVTVPPEYFAFGQLDARGNDDDAVNISPRPLAIISALPIIIRPTARRVVQILSGS